MRYRRISTELWADKYFRAFSSPNPCAKSLWLYLLTGPHTTAFPGLFSLGEAALAECLDWPLEETVSALTEIESAKPDGIPMLIRDSAARLMWLPNAIRHNNPHNPNAARAWARALIELPECSLRDEAQGLASAIMADLKDSIPEAFEDELKRHAVKSVAKPKQRKGPADTKPPADDRTPYDAILDLYNEICVPPMAKALRASGPRKTSIRIIHKEINGDMQSWRTAFENAVAVPGLTAKTDIKFMACLDFILKPTKFHRILEGGYYKGAAVKKQARGQVPNDPRVYE